MSYRSKFMKYPIFNIQILSFSNGHEMNNFEGSVNFTFEIYPVKYCSCIENVYIKIFLRVLPKLMKCPIFHFSTSFANGHTMEKFRLNNCMIKLIPICSINIVIDTPSIHCTQTEYKYHIDVPPINLY